MKIKNYDLNNYKALIFDLDGTLVDSMPGHNKAWIDTFSENGVSITEKFLFETAGMASTRIVEIVNSKHNTTLDPNKISVQKRQKYLKNLDQIKTVRPLMDIVEIFYNKIPLGIITGGSHEVVDQLLPILKIDHYFKPVICSDDTTLGKDSVEPYNLMGKHLGIDPNECLFFDDGDIGLQGAKKAGMDVIHIDINHPDIFIG